MLKFIPLFVVVIGLCACQEQTDPNQYVSLEDTLQVPFDTARVLKLYDMPFQTLSQNAPGDLDTFVLSNLMYACDCPAWATDEERKHTGEYNALDPASNASHDVFYLERGDPDMQLPDEFTVLGNRIRFYGKVRTRNGRPLKEEFTDPNPPAGPVLTVYGYEVMFPAYIYGPQVHIPDTTGKKPDWAQYETAILKVTRDNYR